MFEYALEVGEQHQELNDETRIGIHSRILELEFNTRPGRKNVSREIHENFDGVARTHPRASKTHVLGETSLGFFQ